MECDVQLHVAKASHIKHCFAKLPLSLAKQWKKEDSPKICSARDGFSFVQEENPLTDSSLWIVDTSDGNSGSFKRAGSYGSAH